MVFLWSAFRAPPSYSNHVLTAVGDYTRDVWVKCIPSRVLILLKSILDLNMIMKLTFFLLSLDGEEHG